MSWHFLAGQEAASWEDSCLAGAPSVLSRLIPIAEVSCSPANETGCSTPSPSGTTCAPSTESLGAGTSMSSAAASPARTSAQPGKAQASQASAAGSGWRWPGSFVKWDRASSLWKTRQCSLVAGLDAFSETWPRWGTMRDGECSELAMSEPRTSEPGCLSLPTLRKSDGERGGRGDLIQAIRGNPNSHYKSLPTLTVNDSKNNGGPSQHRIQHPNLNAVLGGALNPMWCEWFMGFPIGWTELQHLETLKFQAWLASHGKR